MMRPKPVPAAMPAVPKPIVETRGATSTATVAILNEEPTQTPQSAQDLMEWTRVAGFTTGKSFLDLAVFILTRIEKNPACAEIKNALKEVWNTVRHGNSESPTSVATIHSLLAAWEENGTPVEDEAIITVQNNRERRIAEKKPKKAHFQDTDGEPVDAVDEERAVHAATKIIRILGGDSTERFINEREYAQMETRARTYEWPHVCRLARRLASHINNKDLDRRQAAFYLAIARRVLDETELLSMETLHGDDGDIYDQDDAGIGRTNAFFKIRW